MGKCGICGAQLSFLEGVNHNLAGSSCVFCKNCEEHWSSLKKASSSDESLETNEDITYFETHLDSIYDPKIKAYFRNKLNKLSNSDYNAEDELNVQGKEYSNLQFVHEIEKMSYVIQEMADDIHFSELLGHK